MPRRSLVQSHAEFLMDGASGRFGFEPTDEQFFPQQQDSFQFQRVTQKAPTPVGRHAYCRLTAKSPESFPRKPTIRSVKSPHVLAADPECYLFVHIVHRKTHLVRFSNCFLISTRYFPIDEA